jgi:hypothetical protein
MEHTIPHCITPKNGTFIEFQGPNYRYKTASHFFLEKFHVKIHILGLPPDFFEHHKKPKRNAAHAMILLRHFEHDCNHFILDKALHSAKNQTLP